MPKQLRTFTDQEVAEALAGDNDNVPATIARFMSNGQHDLVGHYIQTIIDEQARDIKEFDLKSYIESGGAARDRHNEALAVQELVY